MSAHIYPTLPEEEVPEHHHGQPHFFTFKISNGFNTAIIANNNSGTAFGKSGNNIDGDILSAGSDCRINCTGRYINLPATIAGAISIPFANIRSSIFMLYFGAISFIYEIAP